MTILLHGLSLANYRGIGTEQHIGPFDRCNFFVGINNVGKSAVLAFLARHGADLATLSGRSQLGNEIKLEFKLELDAFDRHIGTSRQPITAGAGLRPAALFDRIIANLFDHKQPDPAVAVELQTFCERLALDGLVWLKGDVHGTTPPYVDLPRIEAACTELPAAANALAVRLIDQRQSVPIATRIANWLKATGLKRGADKPSYIPPFRQVDASTGDVTSCTGAGLIARLAELSNPLAEESMERELFQKINAFVRAVTGMPRATIQIPHDRSRVQIDLDDRVLPLASFGTGIHQVVMIASFCTLAHRRIVCIEEPEIHLHPLLQRRLIDYLIDQTDNQYFIATHSASLIDHPDATIFHVTQEHGETRFSPAITMSERVAVWRDLGYKASDLLQANFIVWVEGPSDRLYLLHWLKAMGANLQEGLHFSIMFYGGKLLSHLSGGEDTE